MPATLPVNMPIRLYKIMPVKRVDIMPPKKRNDLLLVQRATPLKPPKAVAVYATA